MIRFIRYCFFACFFMLPVLAFGQSDKWQDIYKVKKKEPITAKQIAFLTRLMQQKNISMEMDIHTLTKSEASREIDRILSRP